MATQRVTKNLQEVPGLPAEVHEVSVQDGNLTDSETDPKGADSSCHGERHHLRECKAVQANFVTAWYPMRI